MLWADCVNIALECFAPALSRYADYFDSIFTQSRIIDKRPAVGESPARAIYRSIATFE
jgi:hypothetical protein